MEIKTGKDLHRKKIILWILQNQSGYIKCQKSLSVANVTML